jgi:hypothetical protein
MPQERPIQSIPSTRPTRSTGAPRWLAPVLVAGVVAATAGYFIGVAGHPDPQASATPAEEPESAAALESGSELEVVPPAPASAAGDGPGLEPGERRRAAPETARRAAEEPAAEAAPSEPSPRAPRSLIVPAGTRIDLTLDGGVSSQTASVGHAVTAELAAPLTVDGRTAVPAGSAVTGRVTEVSALRRVGGRAHLAIAFDAVEVDGRPVPIEAYWARSGRSETGKDAATIAAGAVLGTVLGNQADKNDRGKIVGGVVGAGIGTAIAASTHGDAVTLGPGASLQLTLRSDVEVTAER